MTKENRYAGYSLSKLIAEISDSEKAMSIYRMLHPDLSDEEIRKDFDLEEEYRKYSVFELYAIGGRLVGGYDENDAIADYLEMHPESNETDVRVELERALTADRERWRR